MKEYLGDSVYAESIGLEITLTTEDGIDVSNTIVLEPEALEALDRFKQSFICKCGEQGMERSDNGVAAGIHCNECWDKMVASCRRRSW